MRVWWLRKKTLNQGPRMEDGMAVMDFELRLPPPEHLSGPLKRLQRARSFPKTQPTSTCCPGPSVNLF